MTPIEYLKLGAQAENALINNYIFYQEQLTLLTLKQIRNIPRIGETAIADITTKLKEKGLALATNPTPIEEIQKTVLDNNLPAKKEAYNLTNLRTELINLLKQIQKIN